MLIIRGADDKFIINSIEIFEKVVDSNLTYKYTINGETKQNTNSSEYTINLNMPGQEAIEGVSPKIPEGFIHLEGTMANGYVITDLDQNYTVELEVTNNMGSTNKTIEITRGNEFVWIPVDGTNVTLGYTSFNTSIAQSEFTENVDEVAYEQYITKNKGFYVGRYEAGIPKGVTYENTNVTGIPVSKKGATVWCRIDWVNANASAQKMYEGRTDIASRLMTNKTWDTMLNWMISTGKVSQSEMTDSRTWGNYNDSQSPADVSGHGEIQVSGYSEYWKRCNIYDVPGNISEWTADEYGDSYHSARGSAAFYQNTGGAVTRAKYKSINESYMGYDAFGFRVILYVL